MGTSPAGPRAHTVYPGRLAGTSLLVAAALLLGGPRASTRQPSSGAPGQAPPVQQQAPQPVQSPAQQSPVAQYSSGVQLVEVYATVTDTEGEPVRGLPLEAFEVLEDGRPQRIQAFAAGDFPLSVALAIDRSASMAGERLERAKAAGLAFLDALRPGDQAAVISISSQVEQAAPLSADRPAQRAAVSGLAPWSTTALHDAVIAAIRLVQAGTGRRALVLLSDGMDRYSTASATDALEQARRSDILIYPVAVGRETTPLFPRLATLTGGRSFHVTNPERLQQTLAGIARELREQYLLGYAPARPAGEDGEWHAIQVRVNRPGLRVRARDGYFGRQPLAPSS